MILVEYSLYVFLLFLYVWKFLTACQILSILFCWVLEFFCFCFFFTALNILALCLSEQLSYLDSSIRSGVDLWHVRLVRGSHQGLFTPGVIIARCRDKTFLRTFPDAPRITRFPVCAVGADSIHSHV